MSSGKLRVPAALCLVAGLGAVAWLFFQSRQQRGVEYALPAIAASESLNADLTVAYVGSALCKECHPDQHDSHSRTQHSIALREVSSFEQPEPAECRHAASGRRYRVYFDGKEMRHREHVPGPGGELVLADYAPTLAMGSGSHSYTYLVNVGGFLLESPVTYYNPKTKWDLSPGYAEQFDQPGFSRPINATCINCHSGGVTDVESLYKFSIREPAISCERCHGPGELHVNKWIDADDEFGDEPDPTIVNPARLPDERLDAICSQCHLEGVARVGLRGRRGEDFRPGLRFQDFEVAYRLNTEDEMKVVGHVEQLQLSVCYHQSASMTCITCHNPHDPPPAEERLDYFRDACLQCHETSSCGMPEPERLKLSAEDDCNSCHMPKGPVSVPHVAFTHHRIGLHPSNDPPRGSTQGARLTPLNDISHLPKIEQDRCLGLAYLELSSLDSNGNMAKEFGVRARQLLESVRNDGLRDAAVDSALARIYLADNRFTRASRFAQIALAYEEIPPSVRIDSLDVLASSYVNSGKLAKARPILEKLTELRRHAEDWQLLGRARYEAGEKAGAERAALEAVTIAPHRSELRFDLANLYRELSKPAKSREQREIAEAIDRGISESQTLNNVATEFRHFMAQGDKSIRMSPENFPSP